MIADDQGRIPINPSGSLNMKAEPIARSPTVLRIISSVR